MHRRRVLTRLHLAHLEVLAVEPLALRAHLAVARSDEPVFLEAVPVEGLLLYFRLDPPNFGDHQPLGISGGYVEGLPELPRQICRVDALYDTVPELRLDTAPEPRHIIAPDAFRVGGVPEGGVGYSHLLR